MNITFGAKGRRPLVSIFRGSEQLQFLPDDIIERGHALFEELREPVPAIVDDTDLPEAAPEWLIPNTFTVSNGD